MMVWSRTRTAHLTYINAIPEYCRTWIEAYEAREAGDKERTLKLVRKATAGFTVVADLPPIDFMPELMELYPDVKVVLVRRDPEKWWNSISALSSRTTPSWLNVMLSPIPGWRQLPKFNNSYSRSLLRLAGLDVNRAGPKDFIEKGGPCKSLLSRFALHCPLSSYTKTQLPITFSP